MEEIQLLYQPLYSGGDDSTLNVKARAINEYLKIMFKTKDFDLIAHQSIDVAKHLNGSALHLNRMGTVFLLITPQSISRCNDMMMGVHMISTQISILHLM